MDGAKDSKQTTSAPKTSITSNAQMIAEALAITIQEELTAFPLDMRPQDKNHFVNILEDEVPLRSQLQFQTHAGTSSAKVLLSEPLNPEEDEEGCPLFCMVHNDFVLHKGMDVDHAQPYKTIRERQIALLNYLNDQNNQTITDILLQQPNMNDFFRRDLNSQTIKATRYFYRLCYNEVDNLWLLCHACNLEKSDKEPLKWFENISHFGTTFLHDVATLGDLQAGILLDKLTFINANDIKIKIGSRAISITNDSRKKQGLGKFARDWYFEKYHLMFTVHCEYYTENYADIKEKLTEIRELVLEKHMEDATRKLKTLKQAIDASKASFSGTYAAEKSKQGSSDSGSDSPGEKETRFQEHKEAAEKIATNMHHIKKIKKTIKSHLSPEVAEECARHLRETHKNVTITRDIWKNIQNSLENRLAKSEINNIDTATLKLWLDELYQKYSTHTFSESEKKVIKAKKVILKRNVIQLSRQKNG